MTSDHPGVPATARGCWPEPVSTVPAGPAPVILIHMDGIPDEVRDTLAEYERLAADVRAVQKSVEDIRATANSDDELVTAVVGGRGELLELTLDSRVFRDQDAEGLAASIIATVRAAGEQAEREAVRFAERLVPARERKQGVDPVFGPALHLLDKQRRTG